MSNLRFRAPRGTFFGIFPGLRTHKYIDASYTVDDYFVEEPY
jgi:hypothetical protein